jgi:hypothetical protein
MARPNKRYWTGSQVTGYERKDELLDTIVALIPLDKDHEPCVVDLGAGQGALSERVLHRFERAL